MCPCAHGGCFWLCSAWCTQLPKEAAVSKQGTGIHLRQAQRIQKLQCHNPPRPPQSDIRHKTGCFRSGRLVFCRSESSATATAAVARASPPTNEAVLALQVCSSKADCSSLCGRISFPNPMCPKGATTFVGRRRVAKQVIVTLPSQVKSGAAARLLLSRLL